MAARSSMRNAQALDIFRGASSAKNMATPTPRGTAIKSARVDDTRVPQIKGSAPKFSATGSQICLVRNDHPNAWRERAEFLNNCQAIANAMKRMLRANNIVRFLNRMSPQPLSLEFKGDTCEAGG